MIYEVITDDGGHVHQRLDVVDDRRVTEQALDRRERRLEARLAVITSYSIHYTKLYDPVYVLAPR